MSVVSKSLNPGMVDRLRSCNSNVGLTLGLAHGWAHSISRRRALLCIAFLLAIISLPRQVLASLAGEVVFSVGKATVLPRDVTLQRGLSLYEGDVIVTEAGAHVHVRFADGALLSVRPNSRLSIERYNYHPTQPGEHAVKFRLESGTARSITGKAGEEAKERFRLNTPVAAIGVRGTDFVVATDANASAVAVNSGAIVVSPIGGACARESLGPCSGSLARELSASMAGTLARVEAGKVELMAIRDLPRGRFTAPAEAEPKSVVTAPAANVHTGVPVSTAGVMAQPVSFEGMEKVQGLSTASKAIDQIAQTVDLEAKRQNALEESRRDAAISAGAEGAARLATLSPSVLSWGRWSQQAVPGDIEPSKWVQTPDFSTLVMSDGVYALFGPIGSRWSGGREGLLDFSLRDARVYLRDASGTMSMGSVVEGKLSIDLASSSFKTQMIGNHQQLSNPVSIKAEGYLRDDGSFRSSAISAASVVGVMVNGGQEAAYAVSQSVNTSSGSAASFAGLTRWGR